MTTPATPSVPAGWYPDPAGSPRSRWWDGTQWTEHFQEPYSPEAAAAALKAPEGTKWNTVWIWLVALLPLLGLIPVLMIDWSGYMNGIMSRPTDTTGSLALLTSPGYLLSILGSWLLYGLCALFAFLDWRQLKAFGVPRPFHFAWVFLSTPVYVIGRSVVVRRRTGHGIAPMWVTIGVMVISTVVSFYIIVSMFSAIASSVSSYTY